MFHHIHGHEYALKCDARGALDTGAAIPALGRGALQVTAQEAAKHAVGFLTDTFSMLEGLHGAQAEGMRDALRFAWDMSDFTVNDLEMKGDPIVRQCEKLKAELTKIINVLGR
jgi:hypothetical protein